MKIPAKIAAIIAFFIGILSVISGSLVLLNFSKPNYHVLNWLVIYNVILGGISIAVAFFIWKNEESARILIPMILVIHLLVFLYLYFISNEAATESMKAMGFRVGIWTVIFLLAFKPNLNQRTPIKK